ncbi:MAG: hypothetical protein HWD60_02725 [Defluviicoccus sp.]|nr:MAG: hypothetical protein HWD60_02725 [Defluviicoccus sp.]
MSQQGLSERDYARHIGRSRGSVQKLRAAGRLVFHADGSIDATASDAQRARTADPARQRGPRVIVSEPSVAAMKPVPEAAVGAVSETLKEQGLPTPSAGALTYLQARTANEVLKAQERRLRLQKLKGEVVDRAKAAALVFRLARQERDAWLGWPARIAATMAAELGVGTHELQAALYEHVRDHLQELSEIAPDFR